MKLYPTFLYYCWQHTKTDSLVDGFKVRLNEPASACAGSHHYHPQQNTYERI